MTQIEGSCFCQKVRYSLHSDDSVFQYCHCSRCRKFTGSAFAANLIIAKKNFEWLSREEYVTSYQPEHTRYFTTSFCSCCGSSLPWLSKQGSVMVVPAGTLDQDPQVRPSQQIFCHSQPDWYISPAELPEHPEKPPRK